MFPDVAKLDQAQTARTHSVPVRRPRRARRIEDGIFTFETPKLRGTIDLIDWMNETSGRDVGVTDLSKGGVQNVSKKATVVFAEQQNISKRLLLRSSAVHGGDGRDRASSSSRAPRITSRPRKRSSGSASKARAGTPVIRRIDLDLYADIDVKIISSPLEMRNSQLKKEARTKTSTRSSADPVQAAQVNPRWIVEEKLRSGAEFDDAEIADRDGHQELRQQGGSGVRAQGLSRPSSTARSRTCSTAPRPSSCRSSTTSRSTTAYPFGDRRFKQLLDYHMAHAEIVRENMMRKAAEEVAAQPADPIDPNNPAPVADPMNPNPLQDVRQAAANLT